MMEANYETRHVKIMGSANLNSLKPVLHTISAEAIAKLIFDGLPTPITGPKQDYNCT